MKLHQKLFLFVKSVRDADEDGCIPILSQIVGIALLCAISYLGAYFLALIGLYKSFLPSCNNCVYSTAFIIWMIMILFAVVMSVMIFMIVETIRSYREGEKIINTPCGVFIIAVIAAICMLSCLVGIGMMNIYLFSAYYPKNQNQNEHLGLGILMGLFEILFIVTCVIATQYFRKLFARSYDIYDEKVLYELGIRKCKRIE